MRSGERKFRRDIWKGDGCVLPTANWVSAFVTLFVTIGPIETAVIFAS